MPIALLVVIRCMMGVLTATASMSAARAAHTATALPDGRVLVAGGFVGEGSPVGAETYDAASRKFRRLPSMIVTRHSHTATLLPDGKVLIAGGYSSGATPITAAELFDPSTNTFVRTGAMHAARGGHVAVLLDNGKVLIAGGIGPGWTFLSSAEVYDPVTGRFAPTGGMTVARESHTAVRLRDGRVFIAGGHRDRRPNIVLYASTETYDATTGTFSRTGDMLVRRHKHDAVLLRDGRVLITGGADERDGNGVYDTTELFDPVSRTFTAGPRMKLPRYKHNGSAVGLANDVVLIAGGAPQAETYDPSRNVFSIVSGDANLAGQFSAVATLRDGGALITGGYGNGGGPRASAWLYVP